MKNNQLNKSLYEEIFGGELEVTEEYEVEKSQASQYKDTLWEIAAKEVKMIQRITQILEGMEDFCRSKKVFGGVQLRGDFEKSEEPRKSRGTGVTIGGIRKTRSEDLLVEVKCAAKDRGRLDSAFRDVVVGSGSVPYLVPTVGVEIMDIDSTAEAEEVEEAVRSCLHKEPNRR